MYTADKIETWAASVTARRIIDAIEEGNIKNDGFLIEAIQYNALELSCISGSQSYLQHILKEDNSSINEFTRRQEDKKTKCMLASQSGHYMLVEKIVT